MNIKRLSRTILVPLAILVAGSVASTAQGKIEVVGGDTYDWGVVAPGKLKAAIKVRNIGSDSLKINEVRPACGCTVAPIDKNLLQVGEEATIDVTLDVAGRTGPVEKTITLSSTDKDTPYYIIHLKAKVHRALTIMPSNYFVVSEGQKGVATDVSAIRIMNTGTTPVTLNPPQLNAGNVKIEFPGMEEPREVQPGDALELQARVTPLDDKYLFGELSMSTSSPEMPQLTLSVTGSMKPFGTTSNAPGH